MTRKSMDISDYKRSSTLRSWVFILICIFLFSLGGYLVGSNYYVPAFILVILIPAVFVFLHPFWGLLIFVFFIPLESAFLGLGGGAVTVTRLLGVFIFGAWVAQLLSQRKKLILLTPLKWAIVFIIWALLSYSWAWYQNMVFDRLLTGLQLLVLALVITNEVDSMRKLEKIIGALFLSSMLAGLLGLMGIGVQSSNWLLTLEGQGAKEYASYIGIVFLISTILLLYGAAKYRLIFGIISVVSLFPLFASGERGVILALVLAWLAIIAISPQRGRQAPAIVFILSILYIAPFIMERLGLISNWIAVRFTLSNMVGSGGSNRMDIWRIGFELVRENLLLGTGFGNFTSAINHYIGRIPILSRIVAGVDPHADWLSILGELGLIGFVLFGAMLMNISLRLLGFFRNYAGDWKNVFVHAIVVWGLFIYIISVGLTTTFMYRKVYWLALALAILSPYLFIANITNESEQGNDSHQ